MRLRERDKQTVTLHAFAGLEADRYTWAAGTPVRAAVYPMEKTGAAQVWGERVEETRLMLCDTAAPDVGMGVCVDAADGRPDFRVISVERWDHTRAVLARIPEGRRG